jgi:hypothetical protein
MTRPQCAGPPVLFLPPSPPRPVRPQRVFVFLFFRRAAAPLSLPPSLSQAAPTKTPKQNASSMDPHFPPHVVGGARKSGTGPGDSAALVPGRRARSRRLFPLGERPTTAQRAPRAPPQKNKPPKKPPTSSLLLSHFSCAPRVPPAPAPSHNNDADDDPTTPRPPDFSPFAPKKTFPFFSFWTPARARV